jgi:hypothetical protein
MWPFPKPESKPQPVYVLSGNQYVMRPDLAEKFFPPLIVTNPAPPPPPPKPIGRDDIKRSEERRREWELAHAGYALVFSGSVYGSGTPMCKRCGAAVIDIELHDGWHFGGAA